VTERERICLAFLDGLMEANARTIGRYVWDHSAQKGGSNLGSIGGAVAGRLRKRGLVAYLPDLNAWRITREGRAALNETMT
jgi:hypothetical protein